MTFEAESSQDRPVPDADLTSTRHNRAAEAQLFDVPTQSFTGDEGFPRRIGEKPKEETVARRGGLSMGASTVSILLSILALSMVSIVFFGEWTHGDEAKVAALILTSNFAAALAFLATLGMARSIKSFRLWLLLLFESIVLLTTVWIWKII